MSYHGETANETLKNQTIAGLGWDLLLRYRLSKNSRDLLSPWLIKLYDLHLHELLTILFSSLRMALFPLGGFAGP